MTRLLIKLFIKNSFDIKSDSVRESYGNLAGIVGISCNILLCIIKILIGAVTSSISIIADGLNNLTDMGSSVITMIGFKMAGKPADRDHPFGHGRIEYMAAFIVSMLILLVGFELLTSSVSSLIKGVAAPQYSVWAVIILFISIAVKLWMFFFNKKLSRILSSSALSATAQDCINDVITTSVILLSTALSLIFDIPFNLDAVMAAGVALFILWSGFKAAKDTFNEILGGPPSHELIEELEHEITAFDTFLGIHDLIVHNYGPGRQFASVHVEVPQDIDIVECHEQIDLCEKLVSEKTGVELVIHMDPIDINNQSVNAAKNAISDAIKQIDPNLSLHDFRMTPYGKTRTNLIFDVVVPSTLKISTAELTELIGIAAKEVDPTYRCVITFDNDFTGI